jgi:hypothetical protein
MAWLVALREAVAELVHDRDSVALEGFIHLIPFAAGNEVPGLAVVLEGARWQKVQPRPERSTTR